MDPPEKKAKKVVISDCVQDIDLSNLRRLPQDPSRPEANPQMQNAMSARTTCPSPVFSNLVSPKRPFVFQMDLLSPSKVFDESMDFSPANKRSSADNHTGLTPRLSELQPSKAKRRRTSDPSMLEGVAVDCDTSLDIDSPIRPRKLPKSKTDPNLLGNKSSDSLFVVPTIPAIPKGSFENKSAKVPSTSTPYPNKMKSQLELRPCKLFSDSNASSPNVSASEIEAMMDEIEVPQMKNDDGSEDFLRKRNFSRRCRSMELRKQFADMSNTPTSSLKRPAKVVRSKSRDSSEEEEESKKEPFEEESCTTVEDTVNDLNHERIKLAVDVLQSTSLIADGSRNYCLPVIPGKHSDLKSIHHNTLASLLTYPVTSLIDVDKLTLIDCRYPYEYKGGHIKGAINIYTEDDMSEFLLQEIEAPSSKCGKHILIFYCEFSSQRGPSQLRHLRNCDRQQNAADYPKLTFPEIYCLFGGYKEFFHQHPNLCDPSGYTLMADEKFASDLRHFRAKAKSWAAGEKLKSMRKL